MKSLFANADIGLLGLLFFFVFFVGVSVWVYHPARRQRMEALKHIPLRDEDTHDKT